MDFNKLIEDSFSMLYGSAQRPNLNMLYSAKRDTFSEGFIGDGPFLVGMCCNLLAPGYGGSFNKTTGEIEKGYLTGLAITYSGALKRFIGVLKFTDEDFAEYEYIEHGLREMTSVKKTEIVKLYNNAAVQLWEGLAKNKS